MTEETPAPAAELVPVPQDILPNPSHLRPEYLKRFANGRIFVETGTYKGDTVKLALEHGFEKIETIELNKELYDSAVEMFKDNPEVTVWFGDSVEVLPKIMEKYPNEPMTFWLDAHASGPLVGGKTGPSPLIEELKEIAGMNVLTMQEGRMVPARPAIDTHTIFVDDRRLLGSAEWGFVSEQDILQHLMYINPSYIIGALEGHVPADVIFASTVDRGE